MKLTRNTNTTDNLKNVFTLLENKNSKVNKHEQDEEDFLDSVRAMITLLENINNLHKYFKEIMVFSQCNQFGRMWKFTNISCTIFSCNRNNNVSRNVNNVVFFCIVLLDRQPTTVLSHRELIPPVQVHIQPMEEQLEQLELCILSQPHSGFGSPSYVAQPKAEELRTLRPDEQGLHNLLPHGPPHQTTRPLLLAVEAQFIGYYSPGLGQA